MAELSSLKSLKATTFFLKEADVLNSVGESAGTIEFHELRILRVDFWLLKGSIRFLSTQSRTFLLWRSRVVGWIARVRPVSLLSRRADKSCSGVTTSRLIQLAFSKQPVEQAVPFLQPPPFSSCSFLSLRLLFSTAPSGSRCSSRQRRMAPVIPLTNELVSRRVSATSGKTGPTRRVWPDRSTE